MLPTLSDLEILARTIWGEARGEGEIGMEAVACVVVNRVFDQHARWPRTIAQVCLQPLQFSCWNKDDPNLPQMLAVGFSDIYYRRSYAVAAQAVADLLADETRGANHYAMTSILDRVSWARGQEPTRVIGSHSFFKL